ncbi:MULTISPECIES: ATP-grasp domain-containing protein [unclassified Streptomyces]|uniref:ATP-grasp domain-containing protein n=1 Tax=unclassified Streptomyces TaxID=2593676 RepID=UPI002E122215|nr:ATP-grasp domain-containing protein [Streptomyces sp. NBC_01197]WSS49991.1 ATP-grasp domain-containing protein [Streptomyces sp. NBC_01180]
MNTKGYVVIVDAFAPARFFPPEFSKAGYECVRVQSTPQVPEAFAGSLDLTLYADNIIHTGDLAETVRAAGVYEPVAVFSGSEFGVEFADRLSEAMGLPSNGTALSAARRDKFTMIETVKAAGVRGARQLLARSEDELRRWHEELGTRAVIKPLKSAGNDGVRFCATPEESVAAFRELVGSENLFSERNEGVVAQEHLFGGEYMVNTVSRDGRHHVTDVMGTTRISVNGVHDISNSVFLLPRRGEVQDQLVAYAFEVLDALGVRHGPSHIEIKMTATGPVLIEMGARICGGDLPHYVQVATGESPFDWTAEAYVRPERFHERCDDEYHIDRYFSSVGLVSGTSGTLRSLRHLKAVQELESFHDLSQFVPVGGQVVPTTNDSTYVGFVRLFHEAEEVVRRDTNTLHYLDGDGMYELSEQKA